QGQDSHVEDVEGEGIDRAQLPRASAGSRIELNKLKPEAGGYPMGRFVKLGAGRAGRTAGVIGELHGTSSRPRYRAAAALAGVFRFKKVLIKLILPRKRKRSARRRSRSALGPRILRTSALGST